jgi:hypothetical protein
VLRSSACALALYTFCFSIFDPQLGLALELFVLSTLLPAFALSAAFAAAAGEMPAIMA